MRAKTWLLAFFYSASAADQQAGENPLRKTINLLQDLNHQVEDDGQKAKEMHEKYQCYCDSNHAQLTQSVEDGQQHVSQLTATMEAVTGGNAKIEAEVEDLEKMVSESQTSLQEAEATRKTEHHEYEEEVFQAKGSIAALKEAIPAMKKAQNTGSSLTQVRPLAQWLVTSIPASAARQDLVALFQQHGVYKTGSEATGGMAQIIGVLEQMLDGFQANLVQAEAAEREAAGNFDELQAAKQEQLRAARKELEDKRARLAKQREELAEAGEDAEDTKRAIEADQQFLSGLQDTCKEEVTTYEASQRARQTEMGGISEAMTYLTSDDALELFKQTVPSFVQVTAGSRSSRQAALQLLDRVKHGEYAGQISLIQTSVRTEHRGRFDVVYKMIDAMIQRTKDQQHQEETKVAWCTREIRNSEGKKSTHKTAATALQQRVAESEDLKDSLTEELKLLAKEIKDLDSATAKATENRKAENAEYQKARGQRNQALGLLRKAQKALGRVYGKDVALVQKTVATETATLEDMFSAPPTFLQVRSKAQEGASTFSALAAEAQELDEFLDSTSQPSSTSYEKKSNAGVGIVGLLQNLVDDVEAEGTQADKDEEAAQSAYEQLMTESTMVRESKSRAIADREEDRAGEEQTMEELTLRGEETADQIRAEDDKLQSLHSACKQLTDHLEERTTARKAVVESLSKSKAVLQGASLEEAS